jgi:hypothetical protein
LSRNDSSSNLAASAASHNNNNFARVDSINVFITATQQTISISPDRSFIIITAGMAGLFLINISTFQIESRSFIYNSSTFKNLVAQGRPLIMNDNSRVYAFTRYDPFGFESNFNVFSFNVRRDTPRSEVYPVLNPLTPSTAPTTPVTVMPPSWSSCVGRPLCCVSSCRMWPEGPAAPERCSSSRPGSIRWRPVTPS